MSDRFQTIAAIVVSAVAVTVIVVGLAGGSGPEQTPEDRVAALSDQIVCPFCSGESLADSGSGVAADYRVLIEEMVADGYTDQEVLDEFAANFGDAYVLDGGTAASSVLLWAVPLSLVIGGSVVWIVMRTSRQDAEVSS